MRIRLTTTTAVFCNLTELVFLLLLYCATLSSCYHRREELLHEKGIVVEKHYSPEVDQVSEDYSVSKKEKSKGEREAKTKYTTHQVYQPAKYIVIFRCEHNLVFSIDRYPYTER